MISSVVSYMIFFVVILISAALHWLTACLYGFLMWTFDFLGSYMRFPWSKIDFLGGYIIYLVIILVTSAFNWFPECLHEFLGWIYDFLDTNMA